MKDRTMRVYTPWPVEGSELCQPTDRDDYLTLRELIDGHERAATWRPIEMRLIRDSDGAKLSRSDALWLGHDVLILRPRAIMALGALVHDQGELLPLLCGKEKLHAFNPRIVDAFDEDASILRRFDTSHAKHGPVRIGAIMNIVEHVFRPSALRGVHAFKIPNVTASSAYLSHEFVDAWHKADLRGLEFKLEWECTS